MVGSFISLAMSKWMAKFLLKVQVINPNSSDLRSTELLSMVKSLSQDAKIPMPEVGIFNSPEVNAFATGPTKSRSLIAVSTGLLEKMDKEEVEGVLAHEITHIANGDMVTMTLLQGVVNAFVMFLARAIAYALSGLGRNQRSGSYGSYFLFVFLFQTLFMFLGWMVIAGYSRRREFKADFGGGNLAGKTKMISALQKLQSLQNLKDKRVDQPALQALMISPRKSQFARLFATHPPLDVRISALNKTL